MDQIISELMLNFIIHGDRELFIRDLKENNVTVDDVILYIKNSPTEVQPWLKSLFK